MALSALLKTVCVFTRKIPPHVKKRRQKLAMLIQLLKLGERAAEISGVPHVKGAFSLALELAECVQGFRANSEDLDRLALDCGTLILSIDDLLKGGGGFSEKIEVLVKDLCGTLENVQDEVKDIINAASVRRLWVQKDNSDRIRALERAVLAAQVSFMTRSTMVKEQNYEQAQDSIYDHGSIDLESQYASGDGWIAFNGKLRATQESLIVKRYQGENIAERRAIHEADIKEFKKTWHPNLLQYLGRSRPGVDDPHTVLKGVTSDHVSNYIALKFAEDNQAGSIEALRLLKDLTNALAFTVGTTNSSSFDISKVHLNDSGGLVVVNLDPTLVVDKGSKDDMPQWRSWQQICVELLAGDPSYEPNPSIEYDTDPALHRRLEYLRPILGHIHYGGARFQSRSIEMAFKSEGLVLSQAFHELQTLVRRNPREPEPSDTQVLRAMWRRSRELHYAAHFREPLAIDVGDIGYIAGDPPQFVRLANVRPRITDGWAFEALRVQPFRCVPADKWTRTTVDGVVRHEFRFPTSGPVDLEDWRTMRPRIDKDFLLRRINVPPRDTGLVVECSEAWKVLAESATTLASDHSERSVSASNLILIVYFKQQSGYATFRLNKKVDAEQWREIWTKEGLPSPPDAIYFYEAPPGGPNGVWGYFSLSAAPGRPYQKWTPERDEDGHEWGWTFLSEIWTVEISKPNVKQYIRYVQL